MFRNAYQSLINQQNIDLDLLPNSANKYFLDGYQCFIKNKKDVAGLLVAKNEAFYNVGLLIYTIQQVRTKTNKETNNKDFENCVVIENLVASSPILQKQVFLLLVEEAFNIAKINSCKFVELPRLDNGFQLIKDKYKTKIQNVNGFRTFLKISDISTN